MSNSPVQRREEVLSLERIRQLAELMREYGLSELAMREDGVRVRLRRGQLVPEAPAALPLSTGEGDVGASQPSEASAATKAESTEAPQSFVTINSPMVGTFYNKANPDAEPYVRVGDYVHPDTIVCIIEAMKVFNEIPAEVSGRVIAVLAENEEPVDYGKPMFKIDTSG